MRRLYIADEPARGLCTESDIDARIHENMFWSEVAEEYRPPIKRGDAWLAQAIGVKLLCNMILAKVPSNDKSDGDFARVVGYAVLVPLLALTIGWVVKQFV